MGSLVDELQRREAAARAEAEELRGQIAQLTERLAGAEDRLSRLVITRETVDEVLSEAGLEASPAVMADGTVPSRSGHLPAAGVLAVPPWRAGVGASVLPQAYRDLLEVAEDAGRPLRAGQFAAAAGLSTDAGEAEAAGGAGLAGRGGRAGTVWPAGAQRQCWCRGSGESGVIAGSSS
jgi:hypothetical protein